MQKPLYLFICGITGMALLGACQSESIRDKVAKVDEQTKPAIGKYWPAGVPQPSDLEVGSGGDIDLQKMDLLQYWPRKSGGTADAEAEEVEEHWRALHLKADETFMSGKLTDAAQEYRAAEDFARDTYGRLDHRRLISHFGMVKVYAAELKLDDSLAVARETLSMAEKATPRNDGLIAEIQDNIRRLEQAKAKRSGPARKEN